MISYIDTNCYPWLEKREKRSRKGKGGWKRDEIKIVTETHLLQTVDVRPREERKQDLKTALVLSSHKLYVDTLFCHTKLKMDP